MERDDERGGPRIWSDVNSLEHDYKRLMEDITSAMHKSIPFRKKCSDNEARFWNSEQQNTRTEIIRLWKRKFANLNDKNIDGGYRKKILGFLKVGLAQ